MPLIKFVNHVDAGGYEIRNRKVETVASIATGTANAANKGMEVYHAGRYYISNGSTWDLIATDSDKLGNQLPSYYLDRSKHTGNISTAIIADLDAAIRATRLDQFAAPTGPVSFNSQNITGVADATAAGHAVNKAQLDALSDRVSAGAAGVIIKEAVRFVAIGNITLNGLASVDGKTPLAGDRVLVAKQTTAKDNGIYTVATGAWVRTTDADEDGELAPGTLVAVREGTTEADSLWGLTSDAEIVVGTTPQSWARIIAGSTGGFTSAGNGLVKDGSTVAVQAGAGIIADGTSTRVDPAYVVRKFSLPVPAGQTAAIITHNLNTTDVQVTVKDNSNNEVWCGLNTTGVNSITLDFGTAPTTNQYRVTVFG